MKDGIDELRNLIERTAIQIEEFYCQEKIEQPTSISG